MGLIFHGFASLQGGVISSRERGEGGVNAAQAKDAEILARDAEILARNAEIVELKSKLTGGPGQTRNDALGNFLDLFSENLQEVAGVKGELAHSA